MVRAITAPSAYTWKEAPLTYASGAPDVHDEVDHVEFRSSGSLHPRGSREFRKTSIRSTDNLAAAATARAQTEAQESALENAAVSRAEQKRRAALKAAATMPAPVPVPVDERTATPRGAETTNGTQPFCSRTPSTSGTEGQRSPSGLTASPVSPRAVAMKWLEPRVDEVRGS